MGVVGCGGRSRVAPRDSSSPSTVPPPGAGSAQVSRRGVPELRGLALGVRHRGRTGVLLGVRAVTQTSTHTHTLNHTHALNHPHTIIHPWIRPQVGATRTVGAGTLSHQGHHRHADPGHPRLCARVLSRRAFGLSSLPRLVTAQPRTHFCVQALLSVNGVVFSFGLGKHGTSAHSLVHTLTHS